MCTLVSNLRAQKNWFAIQRREWGRGESGRIWIQFPKTASLNVDRQLLGMDILHYNALSTMAHCTFSSNLFHGQIAQIAILQLSDPEKNVALEKLLG